MTTQYQLNINSTEICRCCLARNCQLTSIFRCDIVDDEVMDIPKVFEDVTQLSIERNDKLPQNICTNCEAKLIETYIFKQKCGKSLKLLQKILKLPETKDSLNKKSAITEPSTPELTDAENTDEIDLEKPDEIDNTELTEYEYIVEDCDLEMFIDDEEILISNVDNTQIKDTTSAKAEKKQKNSKQSIRIAKSAETNSKVTNVGSNERIECDQCAETFQNKNALRVHANEHLQVMSQLINSISYYRCSRCSSIFLDADELTTHITEETICDPSSNPNDRENCCDYQFLDNAAIDQQRIWVYSCYKNIDSNLPACDVCHQVFETFDDYFLHFGIEHLENTDFCIDFMLSEMIHRCGVCGKSYNNLKNALQHVYFHQTEFPCFEDECSSAFGEFDSLYEHINNEHSIDTEVVCSYCMYKAESVEDLKVHKKKICKARTYKCTYCEKTFFRKSTLILHQKTHTNDRPYQCNYCDKAFLQNNDLNTHIRVHTLERPYKCNLCQKSFKTIGQRNSHVSTHTTEQKFKCDVCRKSFKSARILRGHMRLHEEPQFPCTFCDRKFTRRYHLMLHMKQHQKPENVKIDSK